MLRVKLFRSMPFRLALTFCLLFIAAFLVTGFITYQFLKNQLSTALDASVQEVYSVTASTFSPNDLEDLIATINAYSNLRTSEQRVFSLVDPNGKLIAGNFVAEGFKDGLQTVDATRVGVNDDIMFRVYAGMVGQNHLAVGQSFAETDDLGDIALISLSWSLVAIVIVAGAGGAFLASRAQKRLDGIVGTMVKVSNGQMDARIPLSGKMDDIDVVSSQINHALNRLANLVDSMRQVSADIAHELKTPLNRLRLTIEDALDRNDQGHPSDTQLLEALTESERINGTFEALLRISQIEAGARKSRFVEVSLHAIMASVAEIYMGVAEDNGQVLKFTSDLDDPCTVIGDAELLTQLFANVVENAINHCAAETIIVMSLSRDKDKFHAVIADNGGGIPADERENVLQRLYRLDKSRTTPGSGLGLSLVKAIADLHSAQLKLEDNEPGLRVNLAIASYRK